MILKCLKNREVIAGNGANLPDTETGDAHFLWKNSTNQLYDFGKLEDNSGKYDRMLAHYKW